MKLELEAGTGRVLIHILEGDRRSLSLILQQVCEELPQSNLELGTREDFVVKIPSMSALQMVAELKAKLKGKSVKSELHENVFRTLEEQELWIENQASQLRELRQSLRK